MASLKRIIGLGFIAILLTACGGKEPSEVLKADLQDDLVGCLVLTNAKPDDEDLPGLADAFSLLANLASSEIKNKKWSMSDEEDSVTAKFLSDETKFECDFFLDDEGEWDIEKVRRNGEEVFDWATHKAALSAIKERKEAEKEREEAEKEAQRLKELATWNERGYSNASYKYYEKRHENSSQSYSESTLHIACKPEGPRFQFNESNFSMSGERDLEFKFQRNGEWNSKAFDLTSSGRIGLYSSKGFMDDVYSDDAQNKKFLSLMKSSSKVEVKGFVFNMDDLSQIPCLVNYEKTLSEIKERKEAERTEREAEKERKEAEKERKEAEKERKEQGASEQDPGQAYLFINAQKPGVKVMPSGLQFEIIESGEGRSPLATSNVVTHYHGTFINGDVFDSSVDRGTPAEFPVNRVIAGWTEALQMMKEGDKWRLVLPPEIAYGERGAAGGLIAPNTVLVFEVELIEVKG